MKNVQQKEKTALWRGILIVNTVSDYVSKVCSALLAYSNSLTSVSSVDTHSEITIQDV